MLRVDIDQTEIAAFCRRWGVAELALFGSVLHDGFRADSDVDVLVTFLPDAAPTLFDMVRMQGELEELLGRDVDLVSRRGLEISRNPFRKRAIIESAEIIYGP
jgi:uncharacterized protein